MSVTGGARKKPQGRWVAGCLCSVFVIAGLVATPFIVSPMIQSAQSKSWHETPCTILMSSVGEHRGSKGSRTYSVDVTYKYVVDDHEYTSSRYKFMSSSSSGYDAKHAIVEKLRPLSTSVCWVNPRDPTEAVLERSLSWEYLLLLLPLAFVGLGGLGVAAVLRQKPAAATSVPGVPSKVSGRPAGLRSSGSPRGKFIAVVIITLFWNGIVSLFVAQMISGWSSGNGDGCLTVFLIPFELIGLALIVACGYCFLALFNPRPKLRVTSGDVRLGRDLEIEWDTPGSVDRVKSFAIFLQGREEATYRRGTRTSTDKSIFFKLELVRSSKGRDLRRGKAKAALPANTMHSFKSGNNKIVWTLQISGEIPRWPDISEEFEIDVLPQGGPPA